MLPNPFTPAFLTQLETLRLRTRKEFLGSHPGSYSSPRRGTSLEFADYRRYSPGDDLRYLDWGIYARSDRLYVKLFREEVDLFAYIFIDASASMGFPTREAKFLPASHVALALAYVILANHDHVKLHLLQDPSRLQDQSRATPFYRGRRRMTEVAADHSADWQGLGVSILHRLVIDTLLSGREQGAGSRESMTIDEIQMTNDKTPHSTFVIRHSSFSLLPAPKYVRDIEEVVRGLQEGDVAGRDATGQQGIGGRFELAALVMPATVEHIRTISSHGERMPAKSTYFYPKLLSGLVINPLE